MTADELIKQRNAAKTESDHLRNQLLGGAQVYRQWADTLSQYANLDTDPGIRGPEPPAPPFHKEMWDMVGQYFATLKEFRNLDRVLNERIKK